MANDGPKTPVSGEIPPVTEETASPEDREAARGLGDFVRRAVSVGVGAAQRSKEDIMRAAGTEVRSWLERLNVHDELAKLLSKMSVEVKAEIRFKPREDKPREENPREEKPRDDRGASAGGTPEPVRDPGSKPERLNR